MTSSRRSRGLEAYRRFPAGHFFFGDMTIVIWRPSIAACCSIAP
jgi:hypothetical protein